MYKYTLCRIHVFLYPILGPTPSLVVEAVGGHETSLRPWIRRACSCAAVSWRWLKQEMQGELSTLPSPSRLCLVGGWEHLLRSADIFLHTISVKMLPQTSSLKTKPAIFMGMLVKSWKEAY